ncbi:MAG: hypothetical protein EA374_07040 [Acholeplasmatales bacterium]|nr:MAG: hypothetical protein EA374_07040 [Acholeplasmatales bacterium]
MPKVFGIEHGLYTLLTTLVMVGVLLFLRKEAKAGKLLDTWFRIGGGVLLAAIIWNRLSIAITRDNFSNLLPGSFCGASSLFLALGLLTLKRNHPFFHSVAYIGLIGGLITIIYPEFIGQGDSIFYPMTISGLVHHTLIVWFVVFMLIHGYIRPSWSMWHWYPIGLAFYMIYGLFLITVLGYDDAMLIHAPILSGTPLNWFVMGWLVLLVHGVFMLIYLGVPKWKKARA